MLSPTYKARTWELLAGEVQAWSQSTIAIAGHQWLLFPVHSRQLCWRVPHVASNGAPPGGSQLQASFGKIYYVIPPENTEHSTNWTSASRIRTYYRIYPHILLGSTQGPAQLFERGVFVDTCDMLPKHGTLEAWRTVNTKASRNCNTQHKTSAILQSEYAPSSLKRSV